MAGNPRRLYVMLGPLANLRSEDRGSLRAEVSFFSGQNLLPPRDSGALCGVQERNRRAENSLMARPKPVVAIIFGLYEDKRGGGTWA